MEQAYVIVRNTNRKVASFNAHNGQIVKLGPIMAQDDRIKLIIDLDQSQANIQYAVDRYVKMNGVAGFVVDFSKNIEQYIETTTKPAIVVTDNSQVADDVSKRAQYLREQNALAALNKNNTDAALIRARADADLKMRQENFEKKSEIVREAKTEVEQVIAGLGEGETITREMLKKKSRSELIDLAANDLHLPIRKGTSAAGLVEMILAEVNKK